MEVMACHRDDQSMVEVTQMCLQCACLHACVSYIYIACACMQSCPVRAANKAIIMHGEVLNAWAL